MLSMVRRSMLSRILAFLLIGVRGFEPLPSFQPNWRNRSARKAEARACPSVPTRRPARSGAHSLSVSVMRRFEGYIVLGSFRSTRSMFAFSFIQTCFLPKGRTSAAITPGALVHIWQFIPGQLATTLPRARLAKPHQEQRGHDEAAHAEPERQIVAVQGAEEPASHQRTSGLTERQRNALETGNRSICALAKMIRHHLCAQG